MRKLLAMLCTLAFGATAQAQVSVSANGGAPVSRTTLKAAFDDINSGTITGAIVIELSGNTTETAPAVLSSAGLGAASYSSVLIRPSADGITISGAMPTGRGVIELNGADNVTIDGDNPNTSGTNRNLTVTNTAANTVAYGSVIRIATATGTGISSANSNTFRNLILNGNATSQNVSTVTSTSTTTSSGGTSFGIVVGVGAASLAGNVAALTAVGTAIVSGVGVNDLTISNCAINQAGRGIALNGILSSGVPTSNTVTVTNNTIGNTTQNIGTTLPFATNFNTVYTKGIILAGVGSLTATGNTISNIVSYVGTPRTGIELSSVGITGGSVTISNNTITGLFGNASTTTQSAVGILTGTLGAPATISGNTISNVQTLAGTSTNGGACGILPGTSVTGSTPTVDIVRNRISMIYNRNTSGFAARGISLSSGGNGMRVANNFVSDINAVATGSTTGTSAATQGIFIASGLNHQVFFNTVHLFGSVLGGTASDTKSCFSISAASLTGLDVRNNLFSNVVTANSGNSSAMTLTCVQLPSGATSTMNLTLNNNAYFAGTGVFVLATASTLATYPVSAFNAATTTPSGTGGNARAYTSLLSSAGTNDNGSIASSNAAPLISNTNLKINTGSSEVSRVYDRGDQAVLAIVSTDIDGDDRPFDAVNNPTIGADEVSMTDCSGGPLTAGTWTNPNMSGCANISLLLSPNGSSGGNGATYQWYSTDQDGNNATPIAGATRRTYLFANPAVGTYYFVFGVSCNGSPEALSDVLRVDIYGYPTVSVTPSTASYCSPSPVPVTLTASGASTYSWSPATGLNVTTGATVLASPTANATYIVTGTENGCSSTDTAIVTIVSGVAVNTVTATPGAVCAGSSSQLSATVVPSRAARAYGFVASNGATLDPMTGATTAVNGGVDDNPSGFFDIGFPFTFDGNSFSRFSVSPDGWIMLGTASNSAAPGSHLSNDLASTTSTPKIAAFWDDINIGTDGTASYVITGTSPNRILKVQWRARVPRSTTSVANSTFQLWLYETTNVIEMRYGTIGVASSYSIGLSGSGAATNFLSVTPGSPATTSTTVSTNNLTAPPASGVMYTFTPPTVTYSWSPATGLSDATIINPVVSNVTATTTYTLTATYGSCTNTGSVTVTLSSGAPSLAPSYTPAGANCPGTSVTIAANTSGGCGPFQYAFYRAANITDTSSTNRVAVGTSATATVAPTTTTTYLVVVTDNNGATDVDTVTVNVHIPGTLGITTPNGTNICNNTAVSLSAFGSGGPFTWSPSTGLSATTGVTVSANPTTTTTYTVSAPDANSCPISTTVTVTYRVPTTVTATATPASICAGQSSQLASTVNLPQTVRHYSFASLNGATLDPMTNATDLIGDSTDDNISAATSMGGMTFRYENANYTHFIVSPDGWLMFGNSGMTASSQFTNSPTSTTNVPKIYPFWDDLHTGNDGNVSFVINGTAPNRILVVQWRTNLTGAQAASNATYQAWLYEGSNRIEFRYGAMTAPATSASIGITGATATNYQSLSLATGQISSTTSTTNITTVPAQGTMYTFTPVSENYTYSWTPSTFLSDSTLSNPTAANVTATTNYTVTVSGNGGCAYTANTQVQVVAQPLAVAPIATSRNNYCVSSVGNTTLTASITGGCPPYIYAWSAGGNLIRRDTTSSMSSALVVAPGASTTYDVLITDVNGTSVDTTVTITINNPQPVTVTGASRCGTGTVQLSASAGSGESIAWRTTATGTPVAMGNTYTTPVINQTTTYFASAIGSGTAFSAGLADQAAGSGTFGSPGSTGWGLLITTTTSALINSAFVYPQAAGSATFQLQDANNANTVLASATANFTSDQIGQKVLVNLDMTVPAAGNYRLMNTTGISFGRFNPLTSPAFPLSYNNGAFIITNGSLSGSYYTFFDISVTTGCIGTSVPVVATVTPPATLSVTGNQTVCNDAIVPLSVTSDLANYTTYTWSPVTNLYTDASGTTPYTANTNASTVYMRTTASGSYTYTVAATDGNCNSTASTNVRVQPSATQSTLTSSLPSICVSGTPTATLGGGTYRTNFVNWSRSTDGNSYSPITPAASGLTYTEPSAVNTAVWYRVSVADSLGTVCFTKDVEVPFFNPSITVNTPNVSRCGPGNVTMSATGSAGSTVSWYTTPTGGMPVATGETLTTNVNSTTTYYASAINGFTTQVGARLAPTTNSTIGAATYGLVFTANQPFTLQSVDVYPTAAGNVVMQLQSSTGTMLLSGTFPVVAGSGTTPQTLNLNWSIPAGTGLRLVAITSPEMVRESAVGGFPYSLGSVGSITNGFITNPTSTTYYYFYNWVFTTGCESARQAVNVTVNTPPAITVSGSPVRNNVVTVCAGSSATLTVSSPNANYSYSWSGPGLTNATGTSVTVTPSANATYTVVATDTTSGPDAGCSNTASVNVVVNLPGVNVTATASVLSACAGSQVTLNDNLNIGTTAPTYGAAVYSAGGTCITSVVFNTLNHQPAACASPWFRQNAPVGNATTFVVPGTTYPLTVTTAAATIASVWIDYNRNGVFETSEWTQLWTSASTGTVNITIPADAQLGATGMRIRSRGTSNPNGAGDALTSFATGSAEDYTITISPANPANFVREWSSSGSVIGTGSPLAVTPTATTTYTLTVTDTTVGCSLSNSVTVSVGAPLSVVGSAANDTICAGASTTLNATGTGGGAPYTFTWTLNGQPVGTGASLNVSPTQTATYLVTVSDNCGATSTDTAIVHVIPLPVTTLNLTGTQTVCGTSLQLSATTNAATPAYQWLLNGTAIANATNASHNATATGTYTVRVTNGVTGCVGTSAGTVVILTPVAPTFSIAPANPAVCVGGVQTLTADQTSTNTTVTLGTGTTGNTTSTPYKGFWGGSKVQFLYTVAELNAQGLTVGSRITALGMNITSFSAPYTFAGFTIAMKQTNAQTLTTTVESGLTTVFNPRDLTLNQTAPFTETHTLDVPFVWDGVSNLLIQYCFNNGDGGGVSAKSANVASTNLGTGVNRTAFRSIDDNTGLCDSLTGFTVNTIRPNTRFTFENNTTTVWSAAGGGYTGLFSDAAATIAYTGGNTRTVYAKPTTPSTYTATVTTAAGCSRSVNTSVAINTPSVAADSVFASSVLVCPGTAVTLTQRGGVLGTGATWRWYSDAGFTDLVGSSTAANASLVVTPNASTTYYLRAEGTTAPCTAQAASAASVTVNMHLPATGGTASSSQTLCSGSTPASLDLLGHKGTILHWQSATDTAFTQGVITYNNTTTTLSGTEIGALNTTRYFRAVISNSGCSTVYSSVVTITVRTRTVAPTALNASTTQVCSGGLLTLTQSGGSLGSGAYWQWYRDAAFTDAVGGPITAANAQLQVNQVVNTTYYLRAEGGTAPCPVITTAADSIRVFIAADATASISYSGSPYCGASGFASPTIVGTQGGSFSSTAGLSINAQTGIIDLGLSQAGTYTVTYTFSGGPACAVATTFTQVEIRPSQFFNTVPTSQLICAGSTVATINLGSVPGITYLWSNTNSSIGLADTGRGNIQSFVAVNNGSSDQQARITVRATGGTGCFPTPLVFGITVSPGGAQINAIPNQVVCAGQSTTAVNFTTAQGATLANWSTNNPGIGVVASVTNSPGIPSFIARNPSGADSTVATFTVTPVRRGCSGTPVQFTITVRNSATSLSYPQSTYCQNTGALPILRAGAGGTFSATPSGLTIDANTGRLNLWTSLAGTYTVTYTLGGAAGCGSSVSTQVTVLPRATVTPSVSVVGVCRGGVFPEISFTGTGTAYNWTNSNTAIGLAASGSGNIASFVGLNATATVQRATVTVTAIGNGTTTCNSQPTPIYLGVHTCNAATVTQAGGTGGDASTLRTQDVTLSPVPARNTVTVTYQGTMDGPLTVQMVSQWGSSLMRPAQMTTNTHTLDVSGLTPGTYVVQVVNPRTGQSVQKQLIKL